MDLQICNLTKTYSNGVKALDDVNLTIEPGLFGLLGPNGAGKTSLMNTLATLQAPDSGSIHLGEMDAVCEKERVRRHLGYLPQEFGVYPGMNAIQLLDYLCQLKGVVDSRARHRHIEDLLQMVNLADAAHRAVETYSGGMRQRFGIAQALIGSPRLVIVDEPTAGLDPAERVRFHEVLSEISRGTIVLLSTHIVEDVANICSRVAVLNRGRVAMEGTPEALARRMDGRLWMKPATTHGKAESGYKVLSRRFHQAALWITVESDEAPDADFIPKSPDLEDAYFSAIARGD